MATSEGSGNALVLDYASPRIPREGIPEAEALILAGTTDSRFVKLFKSTHEAASFFASYQLERFAPERADGICFECGESTRDLAIARWDNFFNPTGLLTTDPQTILRFTTCHSCCGPCLEAARRRLGAHRRSLLWAILLAATGVGLTYWSAFNPGWVVWIKERIENWFYAIPAVFMLTAILLVARRERQLQRSKPDRLTRLLIGELKGIEPFAKAAPQPRATGN
jgi:hypothetical protein